MSAARIEGSSAKAHRRPAGSLGVLLEPRQGYRFGPENLTLPSALPPSAKRVVDLGAGCGVLGLMSHACVGAEQTVLIEQNRDLAAFARANAGKHVGADVVEADLRCWHPETRFDLVIANPPFFPVGAGRESDNPMVRDATHTHRGDLSLFVDVASRVLAPDGQVLVLYPADALGEVLVTLARFELRCNEVTFVYARHTPAPFRVWVRADRVGAVLDAPRMVSPAGLKR